MKSRTFEVPIDVMEQFAEIMEDNSFDNTIEGVMENSDIIIRVDYEPEQRDVINSIHDLIDECQDNSEEEDDDDEEEADEDNDE